MRRSDATGTWPDREELAWAAGFFDGEGCFSYTEKARYGVATITQADIRPLDRFKTAVRVGNVYGPYDKKYPVACPNSLNGSIEPIDGGSGKRSRPCFGSSWVPSSDSKHSAYSLDTRTAAVADNQRSMDSPDVRSALLTPALKSGRRQL